MKFKLFGRLRGDEDSGTGNGTTSDSSIGGGNDFGDAGGSPGLGSGLEQTVENMFSQGYSEEEIKQELQGQYSRQEIENAVSQVVKSTASGDSGGPQPMTPYEGSDEEVSPMDKGFNQDQDQQQDMGMDQQPQNQSQPQGQPEMGGSMGGAQQQGQPEPQDMGSKGTNSQIEELVETIVAENFEKVEQEFENAYGEIDELKKKVEDLENRVHDLEVRDDEDQEQFIQKMNEIEEDIDSYQSRIGGLEKAFQQVLPSLVDNVRELTSLVQEIKQERGIETESNVSEEDIQDMDMEDW